MYVIVTRAPLMMVIQMLSLIYYLSSFCSRWWHPCKSHHRTVVIFQTKSYVLNPHNKADSL